MYEGEGIKAFSRAIDALREGILRAIEAGVRIEVRNILVTALNDSCKPLIAYAEASLGKAEVARRLKEPL